MLSKLKDRFFSKISNKIFLSVLMLILLILLVQSFVFRFVIDEAYFFTKERDLKKQFELFTKEIKEKNYDLEYTNLLTEDYIDNTNNPIVIVDENDLVYNDAFFSSYFDSVTLMSGNKNYKFILDNPEINVLDYSKLNVFAIPIGDDWYYPLIIDYETISQDDILELQEEDAFILEDAEVISYSFSKIDSEYSGLFILYGFEYLENGKFNPSLNKAQSFIFDQPDISAQTLYYLDSYVHNQETYYVMTSQTFVNIGDQLEFINSFSIFIFIIGVVLAILLTRFYSKSISKPMIELNEIANEMSQLNFSKEASIKSHDEIGSLAGSLNELSQKLEESIVDLQGKNEELTHNYELKSIEEKRAKDLILHLSHELNTPLGIVSGFNEILSDGINDKDPEYYYNAMAYELERMKVLITDMLELSVLESGDYKLSLEMINIKDILTERLSHYHAVFKENNIQINFSVSDDLVSGNMRKMHQVINNFISNASKYTDKDGEFSITSEDMGQHILYRFENTCALLEEEDLSRLWEKFYRTNKTNTRKEKGSGIGLSIAKEILQLHHSSYSIKPTENGISIEFTLKKV